MTIVAETAEAVIPAGTWSIDPDHSTIEFDVRHAGIATVKGRAPVVAGTIRGGSEPALEGTIPVSSLTTFNETRDAHLQSPDFFDAERHPELRFVSTAVHEDGDDLVVRGELTLRGVTRAIELRGRFTGRAVDAYGNQRIGLELAGVVDRTEFGVSWNAPLPGGGFLLPDDIPLRASFSAVKQAEE